MRTITIITLYDDDSCDHFVGACDGPLAEEEKARIADGLSAEVATSDTEQEEDGRYVGFREVEIAGVRDGLLTGELPALKNIWPSGA